MSEAKNLPRLTYFAGRGLAESIRIALAEAGVEYTDNRVEDISALKPQLPFGQVPLFEIDGHKIAQSNAILRYVARRYGLYGANNDQSAIVDQIMDGIGDLRVKLTVARELKDDALNAFKEKFAKETLPQYLGYFENFLKANHGGNGFFAGDKVTIADILFSTFWFGYKESYGEQFAQHPNLAALVARVEALPRIAAWIAKRPVTPW